MFGTGDSSAGRAPRAVRQVDRRWRAPEAGFLVGSRRSAICSTSIHRGRQSEASWILSS
jgi:hypothetical protein